MKIRKIAFVFWSVLSLAPAGTWASGAGTSAALTLDSMPSARFAALGGTSIAASDDVAAFVSNPSSLMSLTSGAASFLYEKGLVEDAYGQFLIGGPVGRNGLALSVSYYDGGKFDLFDGATSATVDAQKDYAVSLGWARTLGPLSLGITGKYFRSELIQKYTANAYAGDLGVVMPVGTRLRIGGAIRNLGTGVKYLSESDSLPTSYGVGAQFLLLSGPMPTTLSLDLPYYKNESDLRPSAGVEVGVGPLALRAGVRKANGFEEYTLGTGFMLGKASVDYAFGMVKDVDSEHRVSLGMRFGSAPVDTTFSRRPVKETPAAVVQERRSFDVDREAKGFTPSPDATNGRPTLGQVSQASAVHPMHQRRVYVVRRGDTLGTIAERTYGDKRLWTRIYAANRHLLSDPTDLEAGQRIVLP